jgi:RsiW-degrading membrane proteinase PrsW (M82 family)
VTTFQPASRGTFRDAPEVTRRHGWWWKALLSGLLLWGLSILVTVVTLNANLVPTLILIGSFLVPFAVVLFAAERISRSISVTHLLVAFFVSGVLGVLGASLLESRLQPTPLLYFAVGLIEEAVKAVLVIVVGRALVPKTARQGALLGATVGAGFAAFESAGYAFNSAITAHGISLASLLETEAVRALLTPLGHVLWTAVFGAALFAAARDGRRYRITIGVIVTYVVVVVLHAFWDSMSTIAGILAVVLTGNVIPAFEYGVLRPGTVSRVQELSMVFYIVGLAVLSVIGIGVLIGLVRRRRNRDAEVVARHYGDTA